jgi:serine/threonine protein kinase
VRRRPQSQLKPAFQVVVVAAQRRDRFRFVEAPYLHILVGCLAQAVAHLHQSDVRIRYNDIKPENVVIDQFGLPVLTEFGLSRHLDKGHPSLGPKGDPLKYGDPEAWSDTSRDERSDIFSLGCVYLKMAPVIIGRAPRHAETQLAAAGGESNTDSFKYSEALHGMKGYVNQLNRIADEDPERITDPHRRSSLAAVVDVLPHREDDAQRPPPATLRLGPLPVISPSLRRAGYPGIVSDV